MKENRKRVGAEPIPSAHNPFGEFFREALGHEPAEPPAIPGFPDVENRASESLKGQTALLALDRKGRNGKSVTLVKGLHLSPVELAELARRLRQACGAGGTLEGGVIEIQGDQRGRAEAFLVSLGARTKRAGG